VVIQQDDQSLDGRYKLGNHSLDALLDDYKKDNNRREMRWLTAA
jgi:hypothetical protein